MNFLNKITGGLKKTRENVIGKISFALKSAVTIDEDLFDEIEEILITGDIGVETALELMENVKEKVLTGKISDPMDIYKILEDEIGSLLITPENFPPQSPTVILIVGVNGTGKTTTIGKLAHLLKEAGNSILLAAADTYRAAAIDQLAIWAERTNVPVVQHQPGSDPSAVVYDAVSAAIARKTDYVIIDTAGRLHTKVNLMNELEKINRTVARLINAKNQETLLVLDATTGQNAIIQAKEFSKVTPLDGIILTKIDGTAKGGVVIGISNELKIPVKYVGVGEGIEDLELFNKESFIKGLFS